MSLSSTMVMGEDSRLQLGLESTWSTPVAATIRLPFLSETLRFIPIYGASKALVGKIGNERQKIMGYKAEGGVRTYISPDEIGYLLYLMLGSEHTPCVPPSGTNSRDHFFTPVPSGILATNRLPMATLEIERFHETVEYVSMKVDSWRLSIDPLDYVQLDITFRGETEDDCVITPAISLTAKDYFQHSNGTLTLPTMVGDEEVASDGNGIATDTITTNAIDWRTTLGIVQAVDPNDGEIKFFERVAVSGQADCDGATITFADSPGGEDVLESIFIAKLGISPTEYALNGAFWKIADEVGVAEIPSYSIEGSNNLRDNYFGSDGSLYMNEINPMSGRSFVVNGTAQFSAGMAARRKYLFKEGVTSDVRLKFALATEVESGYYYEFELIFPKCYMSTADPNVSGPDDIEMPITFVASAPSDNLKWFSSGAWVEATPSGTGQGVNSETFTCPNADYIFRKGEKIVAEDEFGFLHVFKYLGGDATATTSTITFTTDAGASPSDGEIEPIYASNVLNSEYWEIQDIIVGRCRDANTAKWSA